MLFYYSKNYGILLNMITCTGGYCMSTNVEKPKKSLFAGKKEKASKKKRYPISVALERGLNASVQVNIQPTVTEP